MGLGSFVNDFEGWFFDIGHAAHIGEAGRVQHHVPADGVTLEQAEQTVLR
jgi:hypothetical protein